MPSSRTEVLSSRLRFRGHSKSQILVIQIQSSTFGLPASCNRYIKTLQHHASEAGSASVFRQEVPNLLDSLDQAIFGHWVPMEHSH